MKGSSLIKPDLHHTYNVIDHGKGVFLYDQEGKDYLDASSGAVTVNIGHGVDEINAAMMKQAEKVSFVYRSQFTSEPAEKLADKINRLTNCGLPYSFFVNSGSEATETALKIALQYWQEKGKPKKNKIISRWMSYHGITLGALSMSGHPVRRNRFVTLLEEYPSVSPPYCYRCPYGLAHPSCRIKCADELQMMIQRIGADNIAAFICEPVIGAAGGAIPSPQGYLQKIRQICDDHDILLIADEVMTGMGRTGAVLACGHDGVMPDIAALGKGLSGGYTPIAAALVSEKVMEPIKKGSGSIMSGHTFSANPLSCATSLAVIEYLEQHDIISQVEQKGSYLRMKLKELQKKFPFIGDIRGKGLLIGVECVEDATEKIPFPQALDATNRIVGLAQQNGLLLYPSQAGNDGVNGDAFIVAPPLIISVHEMDELALRLERTLAVWQKELESIPS